MKKGLLFSEEPRIDMPKSSVCPARGASRRTDHNCDDEIHLKNIPSSILIILRFVPDILPYLTFGEAVFTFSSLHRCIRSEVYSRHCLKLVIPPRRSLHKTIADVPAGPEHRDVTLHRSFLRKKVGRSILWQILIRGEEDRYGAEDYVSHWTGSDHTMNADDELIFRDIHRTFPTSPMFRGGRLNESLFRILSKTAKNHSRNMGYCQGVNTICASMMYHLNFPNVPDPSIYLRILTMRHPTRDIGFSLKQMDDEKTTNNMLYPLITGNVHGNPLGKTEFVDKVFSADVGTLRHEALISQCLSGMIDLLELDSYLFDRDLKYMHKTHGVFVCFLNQFVPGVYNHIISLGFPDLQFCVCTWFMTLFTEPALKMDMTHQSKLDPIITGIWEQLLIRKWKVLFRLGIVIFDELKSHLLKCDDIQTVAHVLQDPFTAIAIHGKTKRQEISASWLLRQGHQRFKITDSRVRDLYQQIPDYDTSPLPHVKARSSATVVNEREDSPVTEKRRKRDRAKMMIRRSRHT